MKMNKVKSYIELNSESSYNYLKLAVVYIEQYDHHVITLVNNMEDTAIIDDYYNVCNETFKTVDEAFDYYDEYYTHSPSENANVQAVIKYYENTTGDY